MLYLCHRNVEIIMIEDNIPIEIKNLRIGNRGIKGKLISKKDRKALVL